METAVGNGTGRERLIATLERAGQAAFPHGEFIGQESFVGASEALALAREAGAARGALILDLCCGVGRLSTHIARKTGCRLIGVDSSLPAVRLANSRASSESNETRPFFLLGNACHLPFSIRFDAALIFETMLSIQDKPSLLAEIHRCLRPRGRLGLTLEAGLPLSTAEQDSLPEGDRVWLITEREFRALLAWSGFGILHVEDHTSKHRLNARRLAEEFERHAGEITDEIGDQLYQQLLRSFRQWENWLSTQRVRKLAFVAERKG